MKFKDKEPYLYTNLRYFGFITFNAFKSQHNDRKSKYVRFKNIYFIY